MNSAQSTPRTAISTIAFLCIFGLPVQARAQDDDPKTDVPADQNRLKTHIYQVKHSRADDLAFVLQSLIHTTRAPRARVARTSSRRGVPSRSRTPSPVVSRTAIGDSQNGRIPHIVP